MPAELTVLPRVPLAAVGQWETQVGDGTFDRDVLDAIVAASGDPLVRTPRVLLGHTVRPTTDGVEQVPRPAVGHVDNLTVDGDTLYGDLHVPAWLADVAETAVPARSIEAWRNYTTAAGDRYAAALTGVALLSDELPAVDTLDDLRDLWARGDAESTPGPAPVAATRLVACALPTPSATPAADHHDQEAPVPNDQTPDVEETPVTEPEATVQPDPTPEPVVDVQLTVDGKEIAEAPSAPEIPDGFVLMDAAKVAEYDARMAQLDELLATKADEDAAEFADQLVAAGKIAPASRDKIVAQFKAAPDVTRQFADLLPEQTIPTGSLTTAGRAPQPDEDTDTDGVSDRLLNPAQRQRLVERGLIKD